MKSKHNKAILAILIFFMFAIIMPNRILGQQNILSTPILITDTLKTVADVFSFITNTEDILFTYSSELILPDKVVNYTSVVEKSIRDILTEVIADSTIQIKNIDKNVVLFRQQIQETPQEQEVIPEKQFVLSGRVLEKKTQEAISFAAISVVGKYWGTISNNNGDFVLSIPLDLIGDTLSVSSLGYENFNIPITAIDTANFIIELNRNFVPIQEVIIRFEDPVQILRNMIDGFKKNYSNTPTLMTTFYRETILQGSKYQSYFEAVLEIYKTSYQDKYKTDRIRLIKSRKNKNPDFNDSLILKQQGGLYTVLSLDLIKNPTDFLTEDGFLNYNYSLTDIEFLDDDLVYTISFEPKRKTPEIMYRGTLFVDVETLALKKALFSVSPDRVEAVQSLYIIKKKRGIRIKFQNVQYAINYKKINNVNYLNHVSADLDLSIKRRGRFFFRNYTISTQMSLSFVDTTCVSKIPIREKILSNTILSDMEFEYDYEFWENFNIIKPEESLRKALLRMEAE